MFKKKGEYEITFLKVSSFGSENKKLLIKEDSYIDVKFYCQKNINEIINFVFKILEFVNFGTNKSNQISKIKATSKNKYTRRGKTKILDSFEIVTKIGTGDDFSSMESSFLFKINKSINFSRIVNYWIENSELILMPVGSLLSIKKIQNMYFDNQYLNIISAIEIYHRSTRHPDEDAKQKHEERVNKILSQIENSKDKKYIKGKTKYDYEPSLEDRIFNLLNYCEKEMKLFISNFREFAQAASGIRNYLTHRGSNKEREQKAFYSVRGYFIFQISYFLLQISIMKDVGFSGKDIAETIAKSRDMQFEIHRSKELFEEGVTYCIDGKLQLSHPPLKP